mmetsp:Transcript_7083/g.17002  ORF Transcript_7083/g.17002 Transcript_7083/m.17002 type:complete len:252 (+) Transcript_7083:623-1378(+)
MDSVFCLVSFASRQSLSRASLASRLCRRASRPSGLASRAANQPRANMGGGSERRLAQPTPRALPPPARASHLQQAPPRLQKGAASGRRRTSARSAASARWQPSVSPSPAIRHAGRRTSTPRLLAAGKPRASPRSQGRLPAPRTRLLGRAPPAPWWLSLRRGRGQQTRPRRGRPPLGHHPASGGCSPTVDGRAGQTACSESPSCRCLASCAARTQRCSRGFPRHRLPARQAEAAACLPRSHPQRSPRARRTG